MVDAGLKDETGNYTSQFNRDSSIFFSITVRCGSSDVMLFPRFKLYDEYWNLLFPMIWPEGQEGWKISALSKSAISLELPGNFLIPGKYRIGVGLFSYSPLIKHINQRTQISFYVTSEHTEALNPEYVFQKKIHGVINPNFEWSVEAE